MSAVSARREAVLWLPCRINVSAVPKAPRVPFQPLSLSLAYPRFSEECRQDSVNNKTTVITKRSAIHLLSSIRGFCNGSAGEEATYSAGEARDTSSVPGWGRSPGEGNGNSLQYSF